MMIMYLAPIIGIALIVLLYVINTYNKFVKAKELIDNAKAQIATQMESRWDALSSLISAANKYSTYEAETLTNVITKRQQVNSVSSTDDLEKAESTYQSSLSRLIVVAESYPDLKASSLYKETMSSVNKYESHVRLSRMTFNDTVTKYNRLVKMTPANIVASLLRFTPESYLEISEYKKEMPSWD